MSNSARIGLPFLDAAQAQKHVTVNEALALLDAATAGRAETMDLTSPPGAPAEGEAHVVAAGAGGDWSGQEGTLALYSNGGWSFVTPWAGWQLWIADRQGSALYDGYAWQLADQPLSSGGALSALRIAEIDHIVTAGATSATAAFVPDKAIVLGVTARVLTAITGATGWQLGVSGSPNRYGADIGVAENSYAHGVTSSPLAYYGGSALLLTAEGGSFTGGSARIAAHYYELSPPREV